VARTGDYSDLKLRFPLDHVARVNHYAENSHLDPGHVFAVIRQESAFNQGARSPAGAMGLMQLMPATGKITAKKHHIPYSGTRSLFDADKNIHLGTTYLRQVMDRYGNNPVLATASYNAGPHRVQRWLPEDNTQDATIWVANIPYTETRNYVQRVLAYATIYDWRMERPITRLAERMPTVFSEPHYMKPITSKNRDKS
ncbi:MAG: lytic transglycosylase domain-containing protein, partial [Pseudomonadota bacterium]|nr:lytic transglycosylase domain-containing protein [Pseudomonadota bacterium]